MSSFYEKTREFAKEFVDPYAKVIDDEARFPRETFKALGEHGYFKLLIPEEQGGLGLGPVEHQEAVLALAESCPTVGLCYMMSNVALNCILAKGNATLKDRVIKDVVENNKFLALAYSEFGTGTHFYKPEITAEENGGKTTLNGYKSMVTSAEEASYYLVLAPSIKNPGQINNWCIPYESDGLSFEMSEWQGVGMRGNASCPMKMDNVTLDDSFKIGDDGDGMSQVFELVAPLFIIGLAGVYSGLTAMQSRLATEYALSREYPDGTNLSKFETVQIHLAKLYVMAQNSKTFTREAAIALTNGDEEALAKIIGARINASENAIESSRIAMRVGGGKTYNKATQIERLMRDSYAGQIMAPSVDVLTVWLGKALTGQPLV